LGQTNSHLDSQVFLALTGFTKQAVNFISGRVAAIGGCDCGTFLLRFVFELIHNRRLTGISMSTIREFRQELVLRLV
jgi:hypothetical protein